MASLAFDTYKAVQNLRKAGADQPLAEAVVAAIGAAMGEHTATKADLDKLAQSTKADLDNFAQFTKAEFQDVRAEISSLAQKTEAQISSLAQTTKADLESLEQRLTIRLGGLGVAGIVILATLIKVL